MLLPENVGDFRILDSEDTERPSVHLPPDLFCCEDCVAELQNTSERRYRYPFTNCTQCGPRYTIINALPYDRPNTSMADFALCARCRAEYESPQDRRFHAQPLACPDCGPTLSFVREAQVPERGEKALTAAVRCLRAGLIVAVKGVGGYHLMCDPSNDAAVQLLRQRKHRPHKPFATMFPVSGDDGMAVLRMHVVLTPEEADACVGPERPIVLVKRRDDCRLSAALAPGLAELGVFLPYSPLHHLLLTEFNGPLVATSGNVSGEPVITDNVEAEQRLAAVADAFLHHNRPIIRPADDSVLRIIEGAPRCIRVGRGLSPLEIELSDSLEQPTLAVGGHLKATIALGWDRRAVVSPHIGDLDSPRGLEVFEQVIADMQALYCVSGLRIVCDAHPGYGSTRWARQQDLTVTPVQHHAAHASALAGEYPEAGPWLIFAWDGVGLSDDGELWGGETLQGSPGAWRRVASMRPFYVLGGDRVGREPWRSAAAVMWEADQDWMPSVPDAGFALQAWRTRVQTARTSSVGRLFDAASSLVLGIVSASFEGHGPMMLESVVKRDVGAIELPLVRDGQGILRTDWVPLMPVLCDGALSQEERAGIFHESLAHAAVKQVVALSNKDRFDVGLTGGVFQNRVLAERIVQLLSDLGVRTYLPQMVPANDGGIAFGQLIEMLGIDCLSRASSGARVS
jgi:hydrogenase maturation protein HypF